MSSTEKTDSTAGSIPPAGHGKMPKWLFFIWVAFTLWGVAYFIHYALPDLKDWSNKPLPTQAERAK
jgi:hypothetical protein